MIRRILIAACACAILAFGLTGCPSCPYDSRCEGSTLKTCSVGVDQMVGDPSWSEVECRAPNMFCVATDDDSAQCAMSDETDCAPPFDPMCGSGSVVTCVAGYRVAEDCSGHGNVCIDRDGPLCALLPATECDNDEFNSYCDGDSIIFCGNGYVAAKDCTLNVTDTTCMLYEGDTTSAYCGS